ncbi:MAG TPA: amidohydrolase family protein [Candidatus Methylomirabilis sp.]|nr:amidohydrolase family protein [Candidatus Methylomirabilis sp.]
MATSLIRGKYVVAKVSSRTEASVIPDGAVFQRDGTIVEVGPYTDLAGRHRPDATLGSPEHVVVPGFVNGHHHVGLTPFQLGSPDYPLELWFASRMSARAVDPYLDTLYSAFEMLESGITTVQHLHGWRISPAARVIEVADRILKAYHDIGMRVSYSYALRDQNRLAYEADEAFAARFQEPTKSELLAYLRAQAIPVEDHQAIFTDLWEKCGRNTRERARVQLAPANLHWCSDDALEALRNWSAKYQVGMHMHLVETAYQKEYARRRTGGTAFQHLKKLGVAGPNLTLGHGVWLDERDIELVASTGTMVCHNASSNLRLRSGVGPLNHWAARRVRVAIGLDEAGINDDRDMLQEMRLVLRLHRVPGMDDVVPTCPQVFRMATEDGAATTPYAGQIGTLEPGKAADLVLLSWPHIASPYLDPETSVVDAVVHRAKASSVALVMVAGEVVLRDGRFTRVDKEAVLAELAAFMRAPLGPEDESRRRLSQAVFPVVKQFYDGWLDESARVPFYRPSSRV